MIIRKNRIEGNGQVPSSAKPTATTSSKKTITRHRKKATSEGPGNGQTRTAGRIDTPTPNPKPDQSPASLQNGNADPITVETTAKLDPFDPASLRLQPNLTTAGTVKKALVNLRVGKPDTSWWVRVHSQESYRVQTAVIEVRGESKVGADAYVVPAHLQGDLATDPCFRPCILALAVSRQGDLFLWRVNLPRDGERSNGWSQSALEAMDRATHGWVRVAANMRAGAYDVWEATGQMPEPTWPDLSFAKLLEVAFKDRYIDTLDHPILRQLQRPGT
jgi:hypothetical protein